MSARFEELAYCETAIGPISLRRRREPTLDIDVYEVKLGDEFLLSSLFTAAEVALARLGLAATRGTDLDIVVAGPGLGYTARAVLADDRVDLLWATTIVASTSSTTVSPRSVPATLLAGMEPCRSAICVHR